MSVLGSQVFGQALMDSCDVFKCDALYQWFLEAVNYFSSLPKVTVTDVHAEYTVQYILYIVYCILYTVHCTVYTVYSESDT